MMNWIFLCGAIVAEVVGTSALKASDSFTKLWPSLAVVAGYGIAFYLLAQTLRTIPVGVAYAMWSGLGTVLVAVVGWVVFNQKVGIPAMIGIALIIAGVVLMNLSAAPGEH